MQRARGCIYSASAGCGFAKNFALLQKQIGQVHMRDLLREEYPWRDLVKALHDMKFEGFCFAEIPESADPLRVLLLPRDVPGVRGGFVTCAAIPTCS